MSFNAEHRSKLTLSSNTSDDSRKGDKSPKSPSVSEVSVQNLKAKLHPSYYNYYHHNHFNYNESSISKNDLKTNMLKSGLYFKASESIEQRHKLSSNCCGQCVKLFFAALLVIFPMMVLLYFVTQNSIPIDNNKPSKRPINYHFDKNKTLKDKTLTITIETKNGLVQGKLTTALNKNVSIFLGIPYAEPPIGSLRFKKPVRKKPWTKVWRAKYPRPPCLQYKLNHRVPLTPWVSSFKSSEDCLYLNIWSPVKLTNQTRDRKPVMIWIYGGAFISGSSDVKYYDGIILSTFGDVVVVSFNYRVGVLGFLNLNIEQVPGNTGLYDQVLLLEWVQENIHHFGGDPNQVTIFGESAGAFSAGFHVLSPLSQTYFKRAILQSGSPLYPQVLEDLSTSLERTHKFVRKMGCLEEYQLLQDKPEEILDCLQIKSAHQMIKLADDMIEGFLPPFGAVVGNDFLPSNPYELIREGNFSNQIEIMIGTNQDEGSFFLHWTFPKIFTLENPANITQNEISSLVAEAFKSVPPPTPKLISHFFIPKNLTDSNNLRKTLYDTIGDFIIVCPTVFFAENMALRKVPVYYYQFTHRPTNSVWGKWMGVNHFDEVQFVFGVPFSNPHLYTKQELELSARMMETWITFAKTGKAISQKEKKWPLYRSDERLFIEINPRSNKIGIGPHDHSCNLWRFMFQTVITF